MFMGEFNNKIEDKGRIIIPSKLREGLGDKCFITRGLEGCLFVFNQEQWESLVNKMGSLNLTSKKARQIQRHFFGSGGELEIAKSGRITIPQSLREFAELDNEVTIIGVNTRIEIWNKAKFDQYMDESEDEIDNDNDYFEELGI